jgi:hypothetical protein
MRRIPRCLGGIVGRRSSQPNEGAIEVEASDVEEPRAHSTPSPPAIANVQDAKFKD